MSYWAASINMAYLYFMVVFMLEFTFFSVVVPGNKSTSNIQHLPSVGVIASFSIWKLYWKSSKNVILKSYNIWHNLDLVFNSGLSENVFHHK